MTRSVPVLLAALLAAVGGWVLPTGVAGPATAAGTAAAAAAGCRGPGAVTVVVEPRTLGGEVRRGCAREVPAGASAAEITQAAGFSLTRVRSQPSAVCRVAGRPEDDPCVSMPPADAYWALFWTGQGSGSAWVYARQGADTLTPPEGGAIAWVWQSDDERTFPSTAAASVSPAAGGPDGRAAGAGGRSEQAPRTQASPSQRAVGDAGDDATSAAGSSAAAGGVPLWLVLGVLVVLVAVTAGALVAGRRRS